MFAGKSAMDTEKYQSLAKQLQILAHPARLQLLEILALGPQCVCDLVMMTGKRQPYISQQLAALRDADLVITERQGWNIFYRTNFTKLVDLQAAVSQLPHSHQKNNGANQMTVQNSNNSWHAIPRDQIDWKPAIVADRCVGCGLCVTSCGRGVYAFDYDVNKPVVFNPLMCMVGCTTCATLCTQDAIEFPSTGYIRQVIRQKKLLRQSKDLLKADPQKYDIKARQVPEG